MSKKQRKRQPTLASKNRFRTYLPHVFSVLVFLIAGMYVTYPLIFHLGNSITGYGDELNYAWIYSWNIHALLSGNIMHLFDTPIFYPYHIGLADSDPNLVTSFMAIVPLLLLKQPIVVVNFTVISSIVFVGISLYALVYYLTRNVFVSIFSGMMVIFSPAFLSFYVHIQMFAIEFVPLSVLFYLIFLSSQRTRYLILSLIFFLLQTYNNFIAGYFILFSYALFSIFFYLNEKKVARSLLTKKHILAFIVSLLLILPIMQPYFAVSKNFHYVRDIRDTIHFALQPEDFLYSSQFSRIAPFLNNLPINKQSQNDEFKPGFPGITFSILIIITAIIGLRKRKKIAYVGSFFALAVIGFVLSLGPFLHLGRVTIHHPFPIPLPYALFYYILPGFQGFRNSARWEMLFLISMAIVCAMVLNFIFKKCAMRWQIVLYTFLTISCIAEFAFPMMFKAVPTTRNFPKYEYWLATTLKDTTIIELPLYNWNMFPYANIEFWRMYYSTLHFRKTVNGGGGFTPPPWQEMAYTMDTSIPSQDSVKKIKDLGITYLIIHEDEFTKMHNDKYQLNGKIVKSGNEVLTELKKNTSLHLVRQFNNDYIFEVH